MQSDLFYTPGAGAAKPAPGFVSEGLILEQHKGITVVRDDVLPGGTKSVLLPGLLAGLEHVVYATPVYGGFQIALAEYCKKAGKRVSLFCAKRGDMHPNTAYCKALGADVHEVKAGYLNVVEKHARDFCAATGAHKLVFGAKDPGNIGTIAARVRAAIQAHGREPAEIFCAIGSGTLCESILQATERAQVIGIEVGKGYTGTHPRLRVIKYHKPFDKVSKYAAGFKSMPNYDLKAFEYCTIYRTADDCMFWNVL